MLTLIDRAMAGLWVGAALTGAAAVTIAQGVLDPTAITIERIVGGGVLAGAAILIVRWSRQTGADAREGLQATIESTKTTLDQTVTILQAEREAWQTERNAIREERETLRRELMETRTHLIEERNLRISLERAGVTDRRNHDETPTSGDTTA